MNRKEPFFSNLIKATPAEQRDALRDALERMAEEERAIAVIGGGTPFCKDEDGTLGYGKAVIANDGSIKKLGDGPSQTEAQSLERAASFSAQLTKIGKENTLALPYFNTKGMPDISSADRKELQVAVANSPEQFLPNVYTNILKNQKVSPRIISILLSSGYSHAASTLLQKTKALLDNGQPDESDQRIAKLYGNCGGIILNMYGEGVDSPDSILTTPLSRRHPEKGFREGIDIISHMQAIGGILLTFKDKTHCGLVTAGRLTAVRRLLGKKFKSVRKDTPISTITFQDHADGSLDAVNWARGVDFLSTLSENQKPDLHVLVLSTRGKIVRVVTSSQSAKAKESFLAYLDGRKVNVEEEIREKSSMFGLDENQMKQLIEEAWQSKIRQLLKTAASSVKKRIGDVLDPDVIVIRGSRADRLFQKERKRLQRRKELTSRQNELIELLREMNGSADPKKKKEIQNEISKLQEEVDRLNQEINKLEGQKDDTANCESGQCAL